MNELASLDRVEGTAAAATLRARSYKLLGLGPGDICVDVGSGDGTAVGELTRAKIEAIGIDTDPSAVATARARNPAAAFHVAPLDQLPLEDESVDGYRAALLFHLLEDLPATLAEARRVLRPGGRIVLVGSDYGFFMMDSDDHDLTDVIGLGLESRSASPRAARSYRNLLLDAGFADPEVDVHAEVITDHRQFSGQLEVAADAAVAKALITRTEADSWLAEQADRGHRGRFFAVLPTLLVAATR